MVKLSKTILVTSPKIISTYFIYQTKNEGFFFTVCSFYVSQINKCRENIYACPASENTANAYPDNLLAK